MISEKSRVACVARCLRLNWPMPQLDPRIRGDLWYRGIPGMMTNVSLCIAGLDPANASTTERAHLRSRSGGLTTNLMNFSGPAPDKAKARLNTQRSASGQRSSVQLSLFKLDGGLDLHREDRGIHVVPTKSSVVTAYKLATMSASAVAPVPSSVARGFLMYVVRGFLCLGGGG